jgi:hypothetical protein
VYLEAEKWSHFLWQASTSRGLEGKFQGTGSGSFVQIQVKPSSIDQNLA